MRTCALNQERWENWLSFDPLHLVDSATDALRSLHGLYIDVGIYDQYHIQFGSRSLVDKLEKLRIDVEYQEFEGSHSGIDWRLDISMPYLAGALKNALDEAR